jgi:peptide/nickel transport system permease protein
VPPAERSRALRRFLQNRGALLGAVLVGVVMVVAVLAPLLVWHAPYGKDVAHGLTELGEPLPPSARYPLGTDPLGRCVASRLLYGARISLVVGLVATLISTIIGTAVGVVAGYRGGWVDTALMRLTDLVLSFPFLLLALALAAVFKDAGLGAVLLVLGIVSWTTVARVVRARTLALREMDFVQSARALGAGSGRVIRAHILPNLVGPVTVTATNYVAQMILAESTLSFLGFGAQPPAITWGRMLSDGVPSLSGGAPWIALGAGAAVLVTALGFNLLGDGLRDALDPREKR